MTKKLLERIKQDNINVYHNLDSLKALYNNASADRACVLAEIRGYLIGLYQLGFITETEKRLLHCYITL